MGCCSLEASPITAEELLLLLLEYMSVSSSLRFNAEQLTMTAVLAYLSFKSCLSSSLWWRYILTAADFGLSRSD